MPSPTEGRAWVYGVLAQHFWDFAGNDDAADVNLSMLQYLINYNTPDYYINTSPTMTYDWEAASGKGWTIPVGAVSARLSDSAKSRLTCGWPLIGMSRPRTLLQNGLQNSRSNGFSPSEGITNGARWAPEVVSGCNRDCRQKRLRLRCENKPGRECCSWGVLVESRAASWSA